MKQSCFLTLTGIYDFVNLNGGGKFVRLMEKAMENKNYDEIDKAIRNDYADYLYDMYGLGEAKEINLRWRKKVWTNMYE